MKNKYYHIPTLKFAIVFYIVFNIINCFGTLQFSIFPTAFLTIIAALSYYNGCGSYEKQLKKISELKRNTITYKEGSAAIEVLIFAALFFIQIGVVVAIMISVSMAVFHITVISIVTIIAIMLMLLICTMSGVTGYMYAMSKNQSKYNKYVKYSSNNLEK